MTDDAAAAASARARGSTATSWSNGPGDRYARARTRLRQGHRRRDGVDHVRAAGRQRRSIELAEGDRLELPAGTRACRRRRSARRRVSRGAPAVGVVRERPADPSRGVVSAPRDQAAVADARAKVRYRRDRVIDARQVPPPVVERAGHCNRRRWRAVVDGDRSGRRAGRRRPSSSGWSADPKERWPSCTTAMPTRSSPWSIG